MTSKQASSDARHDGSLIPWTSNAFLQSSREFAGRGAKVGYSALVMGTTSTLGDPRTAAPHRMAVANSAHVASPVPHR